MKLVVASKHLHMYNRIKYDLAFGYLGFMDDMILVQVIGYLVILNSLIAFFKKKLFPGQVLRQGYFWGQLHCLLLWSQGWFSYQEHSRCMKLELKVFEVLPSMLINFQNRRVHVYKVWLYHLQWHSLTTCFLFSQRLEPTLWGLRV